MRAYVRVCMVETLTVHPRCLKDSARTIDRSALRCGRRNYSPEALIGCTASFLIRLLHSFYQEIHDTLESGPDCETA